MGRTPSALGGALNPLVVAAQIQFSHRLPQQPRRVLTIHEPLHIDGSKAHLVAVYPLHQRLWWSLAVLLFTHALRLTALICLSITIQFHSRGFFHSFTETLRPRRELIKKKSKANCEYSLNPEELRI